MSFCFIHHLFTDPVIPHIICIVTQNPRPIIAMVFILHHQSVLVLYTQQMQTVSIAVVVVVVVVVVAAAAVVGW